MVSQNFFCCSPNLPKHSLVIKKLILKLIFTIYRLFWKCTIWDWLPPPRPFGKSVSLTSTVFLLINRRLDIYNRQMKTTYWLREAYHVENVVAMCRGRGGSNLLMEEEKSYWSNIYFQRKLPYVIVTYSLKTTYAGIYSVLVYACHVWIYWVSIAYMVFIVRYKSYQAARHLQA